MNQELNHEIPAGATHLEFTNSRVAIVSPLHTLSDFKTMRGSVRFGRLRYNEEFIPMGGPEPVAAEREVVVVKPAPAPKPAKVAKVAAPVATKQPKAAKPAGKAAPKGESVCGYIDALIVEKSRTVAEIVALVLAKFPGRDPKATESTVRVRPSHIRKAGKVPKPFIK